MKLGRFIGLGIFALSLNLPVATSVVADGGDATLIHGCVAKNGPISVVSPTTACKNNETPRHWPTDARIITDKTRITNTRPRLIDRRDSNQNTQQDAAIAALQGQGGGSGEIVVKDSLGQTVGKLVDLDFMFLKIGNAPIFLTVVSFGFFPPALDFYHMTADCSGTRYMSALRSGGALAEVPGTVDGQTLYYPSELTQALFIESEEIVGSPQELAGVGAMPE
jgi:hypothetical protein